MMRHQYCFRGDSCGYCHLWHPYSQRRGGRNRGDRERLAREASRNRDLADVRSGANDSERYGGTAIHAQRGTGMYSTNYDGVSEDNWELTKGELAASGRAASSGSGVYRTPIAHSVLDLCAYCLCASAISARTICAQT